MNAAEVFIVALGTGTYTIFAIWYIRTLVRHIIRSARDK